MATVPSQRTWVTGELVTAAEMNDDIRDAVTFLLQPPLCVAHQTVVQSPASSTWTPITMDAEDIDRDNGHSTVTNTSRYTALTPGWYRVDGTIVWIGNVTGLRGVSIWVNNTSQYAFSSTWPSTTSQAGVSTSATVFLDGVDDFAEVQGFQTRGSALDTATGNGGSRMTAAYASVT